MKLFCLSSIGAECFLFLFGRQIRFNENHGPLPAGLLRKRPIGIDKHDETLRLSCRVAEGLQVTLTRLLNEIAPLESELNGFQRDIQAQERAETLRVFQSKMEHAARVASDALANARERLSDLNRLAAQGVEAYGDAGLAICNSVVEPFVLGESNLESRGWKPSRPSYTRLEFWVRSLTRG
jgi:hypothetical protein